MDQPLEILFEDIEPSEAVRERVQEEVDKLEQFHSHIGSARVVISKPHSSHTKGNAYQVRIHMTVPGNKDVIVTQEPGDNFKHDDAYITIRDAFRAARRQLQDHTSKRSA